jgi:predicted nucleic acid-binding protein
LGYKEATKDTEDFISLANVIQINKLIIDTCVILRKTNRIKLPDAIIAATAIVLNCTLITNNEKDFLNISGLQITNPMHL